MTGIKRVGIVGMGLMGGSLALALRASRPELELIGVEQDVDTRAAACERGFEVGADITTLVGCDLVVLAVPISAMAQVLADVRPVAGAALVTDLASTKTEIMGWARVIGLDLIGGHPMCGHEGSGFAVADGAIYRGAPWVLTREAPLLEALVRSIGAVPLIMDPARHDHLVAGVSHAALMLSTAYMLAIGESSDWAAMAELAGPGFRDVSRLAGGDPRMYSSIAATNGHEVGVWLDAVIDSLTSMRDQLADDPKALAARFEAASRLRRQWRQRSADVSSG
ncbi:MAG TPA: prephenate dehydrogenase/arogenate dehydrogenase family protein [Candidatus Dormibacteraeota bacterium]|nr:prephenate dehydrogenase/arogenate dehydrogenase family protein [Candidatus Dormibacteraeota bacterium]